MENNPIFLLSRRLARAVEHGVDRQLNKSILMSPFRLFYNIFKKKNPQTIQSIRNMLTNDILVTLEEVEDFNVELFFERHYITEDGKLLMKKVYNIGIRLVKMLNVKLAFRAVRDAELQREIYDYILNETSKQTSAVLKEISKRVESEE